jgi:hypothetical protein
MGSDAEQRATVYRITTVRVAASHEQTRAAAWWAIRNGVVHVAPGVVVVRASARCPAGSG